jgi:purine-binding chemotaxis protein CheW
MDILAARKKAAKQARTVRAVQVATMPVMEHEPVRTEAPVSSPGPEPLGAGPAAEAVVRRSEDQKMPVAHEAPGEGPAAPSDEAAQELEMLAFLLGREEYVVPVDQVREVLKPREITPVPHTPDHILGVCSLRGTVLPIVDLTLRLGLAAGTRDEKSRIIVTGSDADDQVGLFVDRVRGVVRFPASAVRTAPETVEQEAECLKGIARRDDRLFIILDVEKAVGVEQKL